MKYFLGIIMFLFSFTALWGQPQPVKIACVQWLEDSTASVTKNVLRIKNYIREAAKQETDILLLPENILAAGLDNFTPDAAQRINGTAVDSVRAQALKSHINVILPIRERVGEKTFNSAVIVDRNGGIAGIYRATHGRHPDNGGYYRGDLFPVFKLDFGTIGILVGLDARFPEAAASLALDGAEILFIPHRFPVDSEFEWGVLARSRAIDNGVFVATASLVTHDEQLPENCLGKTAVIGKDGTILADRGTIGGVLFYRIANLKQPSGPDMPLNWQQLYRKMRRPQIYQRVVEEE